MATVVTCLANRKGTFQPRSGGAPHASTLASRWQLVDRSELHLVEGRICSAEWTRPEQQSNTPAECPSGAEALGEGVQKSVRAPYPHPSAVPRWDRGTSAPISAKWCICGASP